MAEFVEVDVEIKRMSQSGLAYLVDDGYTEAWIPISQIQEYDADNLEGHTTITIPEWLAEDKGLI